MRKIETRNKNIKEKKINKQNYDNNLILNRKKKNEKSLL